MKSQPGFTKEWEWRADFSSAQIDQFHMSRGLPQESRAEALELLHGISCETAHVGWHFWT
jgi:hypothetical protein